MDNDGGSSYRHESLFGTSPGASGDDHCHDGGGNAAGGGTDGDMEEDITSLTIEEFVRMSKALLQPSDMKEIFCKFVLTGAIGARQYQIDPIKDAVTSADKIAAARDYDSMLGIGDHILLDADVTLHPVCRITDTLARNVHIRRSFSNVHGDFDDVPLHEIPNLCIGKWGGDHNMLRAFIPGLYNKERSKPWMSQGEYETFYNKGFRPAVEGLSPATSQEWPPSYRAELFRARGKTGVLSFQTKTLGHWLVGGLGDAIRLALRSNSVPWGDGIFFLYQVRGVKSSNVHRASGDAADQALNHLFRQNGISLEARLTCEWWIDVGLELSSGDGRCLAWRTDYHFHVVKNVLDIPATAADRITSPGSSKYIRDLTSHLTAVSGCRISPGPRAEGPYKARYLQMYTTDKSVTYRPEGSHFGKHLTGKEVVEGRFEPYIRGLYDLYRDASNVNEGHARVELRVPLEYATQVLLEERHGFLQVLTEGLIAVPSVAWWSLRAFRALAFLYVLEQQSLGPGKDRVMPSALLLTAAAPWFLNGLHSAPDNGFCSRDLIRNILPLTNRENVDQNTLVYPLSTRARPLTMEEEEGDEGGEGMEGDEGEGEGGDDSPDNISVASDLSGAGAPNPPTVGRTAEMVPHAPYGMIFLREIRMDEAILVPRFRYSSPGISPSTFFFIFRKDIDTVTALLTRSMLIRPPNPDRVVNKMHRTAIHVVPPEQPSLFQFTATGLALNPPPRDDGSDISGSEAGEASPVDLDAKVTALWLQFLVDVTAKAPNRRASEDSSYCVLSADQRKRVNEDTYRNLTLRDYFNQCLYRTATEEEWTSAFNKFWPAEPWILSNTQNFKSMKYYTDWGSMVMAINQGGAADPEAAVTQIRSGLARRFRRLYWIPNVQSDRVWYTKPPRGANHGFLYLDGRTGPAPRIMIRWDKVAIL